MVTVLGELWYGGEKCDYGSDTVVTVMTVVREFETQFAVKKHPVWHQRRPSKDSACLETRTSLLLDTSNSIASKVHDFLCQMTGGVP